MHLSRINALEQIKYVLSEFYIRKVYYNGTSGYQYLGQKNKGKCF